MWKENKVITVVKCNSWEKGVCHVLLMFCWLALIDCVNLFWNIQSANTDTHLGVNAKKTNQKWQENKDRKWNKNVCN